MACTKQSALDYVRSARRHLVRELKSLSVILENLYQQGIFSDEEVSKIQTEKDDYDKTRKILDSVTKKGEAASYEFLRIIDMTRKRTLERPSLLPEQNSVASSEKFDLHHWISCFSFKEDTQMDTSYLQGPKPCHQYQAKLKSKAQKLSNKFWMANKNLFDKNNPGLSYTSLVLDTQGSGSPSKIKKFKSKKSKMSRPKKLRTYIPVDRPEISPSYLLKTTEDIVLVGKPGIGKTALTYEMLKLWAERDNKELDYMFYFDMREASRIKMAKTVEELLFSVCEPDEGKEEVLKDMKKNSDNVTIIFDGITDLSSSVVQALLDKDLLPAAKVIVTCRPDDEDDFFSGDCLKVEVKGFSEQAIKRFLSAILDEEQKKVLNKLELLSLCHVPLYALMVAACLSSETPEDCPQPCSVTEIYINIVRFCLQVNSNKTKNKHLNSFISSKSEEILSLAEVAFHATEGKTVNLTELRCEDRCVLSFLKPLVIKVARTETMTKYAFLHYTMQEFFAALWLLKNPDKVKDVFRQCLTEEMKHMKHLIPFMCRMLTEKNPNLMKCLIPAQELKDTSNWFFKEMITTFFPCLHNKDETDAEDSELDLDLLFLCQCLYESQCPEACTDFLGKLDYQLDLSGKSLDPDDCCAVAYVVTQSKERKISLNLENVMVSERGMKQLFGCLPNVQWCDALPRQLWEIFLLGEGQMDHTSLLSLGGNRLHLPVTGQRQLFEKAVKVMKKMTTKVNVCLHWNRATSASPSLCECLLEALPHISSLSFVPESSSCYRETRFFGNVFCAAAERQQQTGEKTLELLASVCTYQTFPFKEKWYDFLLDLYSDDPETGRSVVPSLQSVFHSAPTVWSIDLSERKASILLEVLKLQSERKQVKLTGWSDDQSEVRSFLHCLPYISQLSFSPWFDVSVQVKFFANVFCAAAERQQQTGEKTLELLASVCTYQTFPFKEKWYDFLLDLYSDDPETGRSVVPSLQSVFHSAPTVWSIDLSKRKTSILLEVLKLQSERKQVKLRGWSDDQSEVRSFLHCLPYISQLSFSPWSDVSVQAKFFGNVFCAAAERQQQTGEKTLELLSSVCTYKTFPFKEKWYDFLLDLYSDDPETGRSVVPSLQSVFHSAPTVWYIDLSERKTSILLEVLKLQSQRKQVELTGWSDDQSEVRSFLHCLPYISQLSFSPWSDVSVQVKFFANVFCAAAERQQQTGEKTLELLSSVCKYETFPFHYTDMINHSNEHQCDFLLDVFSHVKDYESKTGRSVVPSLQSVFHSAPTVWSIDLSERKASILLEVLKLQSQRKQVKLRDCSDDQSEVRSFLHCLPYISQLSFYRWSDVSVRAKFFVNVFCAAAERQQQTGEKTLELLSSVCTYETFPFHHTDMKFRSNEYQCDFLLDVFSHVKDYESKTGRSVVPSLQSVFHPAPTVWSIDLSKRKTSILLEVLKLQSQRKQVKLRSWSDDQSEVRSFLHCLPYISQLSFSPWSDVSVQAKFFGNVFCAAAERQQQTGEKTLERLSSVCTYKTFPFYYTDMDEDYDLNEYECDFLLDVFSHVKDYESKTGRSVVPSLPSFFHPAPTVWSIDLSKRKASILLEVLKLQSQRKQVKLTGCSDDKSEVRSFLHCLPYISQISFSPWSDVSVQVKFFGNVFCAAAERQQQTGEKTLELLASVCTYKTFTFHHTDMDEDYDLNEYKCDFLLDVFSHVKDYESKTGRSVVPSLQSVFHPAPTVWSIDLSERKASILLEVLKLQSQRKQVELTGCSDDQSEVRSFLHCLPYISQLSFSPWSDVSVQAKFFGNVFCAAAERQQQTGEKTLELLSSVCKYETFPFHYTDMDDDDLNEYECDFLLDVFSHVKDYESKTGRSVVPSLQSFFHLTPTVWSIDLSKRKASILLEVLKLQSQRKQVKLRGWSDDQSEVRSFLHCLPYISQLSFSPWSDVSVRAKFFGNVFCAAAERQQQTGEKTLELLSSVCTYETFPFHHTDMKFRSNEYQCDFLLDVFSHVKDYESETGRSVAASLQSVFHSAPTVWSIDLSKRKASILLEVLKLQSQRKQVKLRGCSDDQSEVRSFLHCLPYISQLSFSPWSDVSVQAKFFGNVFCAAAERQQQTGEKTLERLSSVCKYETFPFKEKWYDFLLDLYSDDPETGRSVVPSLQSVFHSAPTVWSIDLSERKASILLEVLKLQSQRKQVKLRGCSDDQSEVRSFLHCLPYISQISFSPWSDVSVQVKFFANVFCAAAERQQQTGEKTLELLSSVCTYETFPFHHTDMKFRSNEYQCDFQLDVFSHVKDYESKTGRSVVPSLPSFFHSAPTVWSIDLSKRKASILLEVLKLQSERKQVKLTGCSDDESEVRSFLHCLPYISQLSCDPKFFQRVSTFISVRSREEAEQFASLLQVLGFNLLLTDKLRWKTCRSVGRILRLCGSNVDLILTPTNMSVRGASLLFGQITQLHSLRLSNDMALLLFQWVIRERTTSPLAVEELSLAPQQAQPSERVLLKVVSSLASLLRYWEVRRLDLTELCVPAQGLIPLLLHDGPITIKLSEQMSQQLLSLLHETQDQDLTRSFFRKVGGDLSSCCLNWELLHYLLQQSSAQTITVNLRKNRFLQESITRLLPFLDRIVFKMPCPSFVLTAIREIYGARASPIIPSLLRSFNQVINLTCREVDSVDCAALLFTLRHSDRVKLKLLWASIPTGGIESILSTLDKVSQLSVDRNLLLRFVHCCAASDTQRGAAVDLLRTLQHRLDLSCSSCVELPDEGRNDNLSLTGDDCRAISTILRHSSQDTQLNLQDCEVEDSGLDPLLPVLDRVHLRANKAVVLQLVSLVPVNSERDTLRRAASLCRALGGELDLSHTTLDQRLCGALAQMLEFCEGLTELDLSHCELTDQLLLTLITHLHKVHVLDLSHNQISDASNGMLLQLVSINPSIETVRLFRNNIVDRKPFRKDKRFEIW